MNFYCMKYMNICILLFKVYNLLYILQAIKLLQSFFVFLPIYLIKINNNNNKRA